MALAMAKWIWWQRGV